MNIFAATDNFNHSAPDVMAFIGLQNSQAKEVASKGPEWKAPSNEAWVEALSIELAATPKGTWVEKPAT